MAFEEEKGEATSSMGVGAPSSARQSDELRGSTVVGIIVRSGQVAAQMNSRNCSRKRVSC